MSVMPQPSQIKILYLWINCWKPIRHCKINCEINLEDQVLDLPCCVEIYKKSFLQIRAQESERYVLRCHWVKNCDPSVIEINRFNCLVFHLTQSPFIPEGTLKEHFQYKINKCPKFRRACIWMIWSQAVIL